MSDICHSAGNDSHHDADVPPFLLCVTCNLFANTLAKSTELFYDSLLWGFGVFRLMQL